MTNRLRFIIKRTEVLRLKGGSYRRYRIMYGFRVFLYRMPVWGRNAQCINIGKQIFGFNFRNPS